MYAPTWLAFSRLLENAFANQKMILVIFAHASKAKLSSRFLSPPLRQREITPRKLKKWPKLNLWDWSQVLINPIIFAPFTFSLALLLYHNLDLCILIPVDTRRRFNVYKTSIRRQRRRIDVWYTLKRRRVSIGMELQLLLRNRHNNGN